MNRPIQPNLYKKPQIIFAAILFCLFMLIVWAQSSRVQADESLQAGGGSVVYLPLVMNRFPPIPLQPTLQIAQQSASVYQLTWSIPDPNTIDYFVLEQSPANDFSITTTLQITGTSYSVDISADPFPHYFRITGVNQYGTSPYSNVVSAIETELSADRTTINANAGECTTVRWSFTGTEKLLINHARGVDKVAQPETSSMQVCPSVTTTYEATAFYHDGTSVTQQVQIAVTGDSCNRDPYVAQYNPTTTVVYPGEEFTVTWDVRCASKVFLQVGADIETEVNHYDQVSYVIHRPTEFKLRVVKYAGGTTVFEEPATFGVSVHGWGGARDGGEGERGKGKVKSGKWKVESGKWRVESGKWGVER